MTKLQVLWALLLAFLSPAVEGDVIVTDDDTTTTDDDDDTTTTDDDDDTTTTDDDDDTTTTDDDTPAPEPRVSRAQKAIIETRARAQKAESDLATARAELEAARRGPAQPAQPTEQELLWRQEEEALRNPEIDSWQKYAIQSARGARAAEARSNQALQRAEDLADKTAFAALATTKPKLYATYKDKVEETLAQARKSGANPSRENVLAFMIGQDMIRGNLKTSEGKPTKPSSAPRAAVRSDVAASSGGRMSDAEKRARRLENVRI